MLSKVQTVELFVRCSNCHRSFSKFDSHRVELRVVLDEVHSGEWVYCSTRCMDAKLENINWDQYEIPIKILTKEKLTDSPELWVVKCKTDLKAELL